MFFFLLFFPLTLLSGFPPFPVFMQADRLEIIKISYSFQHVLALSETSVPGSLRVVLPQFSPSLALPSLHAVLVLPALSHPCSEPSPAPERCWHGATSHSRWLPLAASATGSGTELVIPDTNPTLFTAGNGYTRRSRCLLPLRRTRSPLFTTSLFSII